MISSGFLLNIVKVILLFLSNEFMSYLLTKISGNNFMPTPLAIWNELIRQAKNKKAYKRGANIDLNIETFGVVLICI